MLAFHEINMSIWIFSTLWYIPLPWQKHWNYLLPFVPQEGKNKIRTSPSKKPLKTQTKKYQKNPNPEHFYSFSRNRHIILNHLRQKKSLLRCIQNHSSSSGSCKVRPWVSNRNFSRAMWSSSSTTYSDFQGSFKADYIGLVQNSWNQYFSIHILYKKAIISVDFIP